LTTLKRCAALLEKLSEKMNTDYVILISTKSGRTWKYAKDDKGWAQTAPTGKVRMMTAEQLLSHLLPALALEKPSLTVKVEEKRKTEF